MRKAWIGEEANSMILGIDNFLNIKKSFNVNLNAINASFGKKIKLYKKRALEVENYLRKHPNEWGKFQDEFNSEMNNIFRDIMNFEKDNLSKGENEKVDKLKKIFRKRLRHLFVRGIYSKWTVDKPLGYAGDYKIMDDIYQNNPTTTGYARLFDNYYQMTSMCVGVRNRKEDFKHLIIDFVNKRYKKPINIMNLGCGSSREIKEILRSSTSLRKDVFFDCYDFEAKAINFAKKLFKGIPKVKFIQKNILRIAAAKNVKKEINKKYDLIYAIGFVDYLNKKITTRLIHNLKKLLKTKGILMIANVRDKYSNPTFHYMDWAGEWELIYRTDNEFKKLFTKAGFKEKELRVQYEQQGIMQYIIATNLSK